MARIAGVDLPREKRLDIGLTYIYGIGRDEGASRHASVRTVNPATRVRDLTDEEVVRIRDLIGANYRVEGDLRREVNQHIKRKIEIGSLPGSASPPWSPGPRSEDTHERPYPQGSEEDGRRQEEDSSQEVSREGNRIGCSEEEEEDSGGGKRRTSSTASRTSSRRSTTRSSRSPTSRGT